MLHNQLVFSKNHMEMFCSRNSFTCKFRYYHRIIEPALAQLLNLHPVKNLKFKGQLNKFDSSSSREQ